jgi:hypothetical protein
MTYIPAKYDYSPQIADHEDFGVKDAKGRAVGGALMKRTVTITADDRKDRNGYVTSPDRLGVWYTVAIQSTRDSKTFGATVRDRYFRTPEERDAYGIKARERARKAAIRKHGKG